MKMSVDSSRFQRCSPSIETNSKDLIFTDPPYNEADLPLYRDLGLFANRVLRPGGRLVCYAGHYALRRYLTTCEIQG